MIPDPYKDDNDDYNHFVKQPRREECADDAKVPVSMAQARREKALKLDGLHRQMGNLIHGTCNAIGCADCGQKWPKDADGNTCRSDVLQGKIMELENENAR